MKEIKITDFEGIRMGHAQDTAGGTGCTVIICETGMPAGIDIRGGGPASRETRLLDPQADAELIHAVLLSGGSAYGLDAAGGVMKYLEERGIGLDVVVARVPLVCQTCIFDLNFGDKDRRPDAAMAYDACMDSERYTFGSSGKVASAQDLLQGNVGAGTGATVGKLNGNDFAMKSGFGTFALQIGDLKVGAAVVVNAIGDVYDCDTGKIIAGMLNSDKNGFADSELMLYKMLSDLQAQPVTNTAIGAIITNAELPKSRLNKVAGMAHNGFARSIKPVHTSMDGDTIYALSVGNVKAHSDIVGTLAARVMSYAIRNAVMSSQTDRGFISAQDMVKLTY